MGKQKSDDKKKKKKSSQLVIRIDAGERDAFVKLCDTLDTSAAREIRKFMRDWVAAHAQPDSVAPAADENAAAEAGPSEAAPKTAPKTARKPAPKAAPEVPVAAEAPADEKPVARGRRKRVVEATA